MSRGWELNRLCREIIKENENARKEMIEKPEKKQKEFREKRETNRKITEMLESIPEVEAQKIEKGMKRKEHHEKKYMEKVERKSHDRC